MSWTEKASIKARPDSPPNGIPLLPKFPSNACTMSSLSCPETTETGAEIVSESQIAESTSEELSLKETELSARKAPRAWTLPSPTHTIKTAKNDDIQILLQGLIDQWIDPAVTWTDNHNIVNMTIQDAEKAFKDHKKTGPTGQLRKAIEKDKKLFRIDLQTHFDIEFQDGKNVGVQWIANLQGQYGNDTYFHLNVTAKARKGEVKYVQWGAAGLKEWLQESLDNHKSVTVVTSNPAIPNPTNKVNTYTRTTGTRGGVGYIKFVKD
ncbi:uncharacterized protein FIBRA_04731 [Fibroporia radiculosa]|uniref:Uncharacterized protein n=1 Tax=Fibroporia radiculosa TaxID=599839 RepID=J4G7V3_9APHY|nr:uncharacterized protein FIBRA_04731 [Fibroporia radiculosa]CCM02628.1 predicted protein [Fibroporia radiculosa]